MRRTVRLVVVLSALAALLAPAALAGERMWVGFHDDPSFRWVNDRQQRVAGAAGLNADIIRLLVQWNLVAKTRPTTATDPFDPAYEFSDIDEAVRAAQENDQEVILTISGTPKWANGGKSPNVMPTRVSDFTFLRACHRVALLGSVRRLPVRPVLVGLERAEPPALPVAAVRLAGPLGRPGELREARRRGIRGDQGGQPQGARLSRRDLGARQRQGQRPAPDALAGQVRRARREGEPAPEVRRVVTPPLSVQPELAAAAGRQVAERLTRVASALRRQPQEVVPP